MKKLLKLKMNLQMFAEGGDGAGGDGGDNAATGSTGVDATGNSGDNTNDDSAGDDDNQKPSTPFKSFASEKDWQSSVDKLIASAIETHDKKKASEAQQQKDYDKMTDLEKAKFDNDKLTKQLADANRATAISNNRASVTAKLGADDLPTTLIAAFSDDVLADEKGVEEAYTNISKAFKDSLQKAIDKRIANSGTTLPGSNTSVNKSEGATAAEELNNSQKPAKSSLWTTK